MCLLEADVDTFLTRRTLCTAHLPRCNSRCYLPPPRERFHPDSAGVRRSAFSQIDSYRSLPSSYAENNRHKEKDADASGDGTPAGGGEAGANAAGGAPDAEPPSAANGPTKFTLTANECLLVRELFAWLVEPCLAFLRREVTEMVSRRWFVGGDA